MQNIIVFLRRRLQTKRSSGSSVDNIQLEDGSNILLEDDSFLLLE